MLNKENFFFPVLYTNLQIHYKIQSKNREEQN